MFTAWSKIKYFATIGSSLTLAKFVKKQIFTSVRRDLEKIKIETTTKMNGISSRILGNSNATSESTNSFLQHQITFVRYKCWQLVNAKIITFPT